MTLLNTARRTAIRVVLIALLVVAVATSPAHAARGGHHPTPTPAQPTQTKSKVAIVVQTGTSRGGDSRGKYSYVLMPGAVVYDWLALTNLRYQPITVHLTARDAHSTADGPFTIQLTSQRPTGVASWIAIRVPTVTIPPRTEISVPFQLGVPPNASPGDYAGAVLCSVDQAVAAPHGGTILVEHRVGMRLFLRVPGVVHPSLTIHDLKVDWNGGWSPSLHGTATATFIVSNTGNVSLSATGTLSVTTWIGSAHAVPTTPLTILLPGGSELVRTTVPAVFAGAFAHARVTLDPRFVDTALAGTSIAPVSARAFFWAWSWLLTVLVLLLVLAFGGFRWWWRRRRAKRPAPEAGPESESDRVPLLTRASALIGAVVIALVSLPATATAAGTPYHDPNAIGQIGLCDASGHQVTSGSVNTTPFAWRAVSTVPPAKGYGVAGRTATLFAYQPRVQTPAGNWSGQQLTASSRYSNPQVPIVAATKADPSLSSFLSTFPALWDGLIQLRIYDGAPGQPVDTVQYAATDVRISGGRWSQVESVKVDCAAGRALSMETILLHPTPQATSAHRRSPAAPASADADHAKPNVTTTSVQPTAHVGAASAHGWIWLTVAGVALLLLVLATALARHLARTDNQEGRHR